MNKVILKGNLTRDPELKMSGETTLTKFSLAVSRKMKKDESDFINCVAFGKTAEFIANYFNKGSQILIVGRIQTGSYDDKEGNKKYTTDVVVEEVEFCGKKEGTTEKKVETSNGFTQIESDDSDLPF